MNIVVDSTAAAAVSLWIKILSQVFVIGVVPVSVALIVYYIVDTRGEFRKRRMYSRLGVAIINELQEEIQNGIRAMRAAEVAIEDDTIESPPATALPRRTWQGMSTIPDEVFLRVIETSGNPLCRTHCKNYFGNICEQYDALIAWALQPEHRQEWREPLRRLLLDPSHFLQAAEGVDQMLEQAKGLLEQNARRRRPR